VPVAADIMKAGASSTPDIINGVRACCLRIADASGSLKLTAVGDQSVFRTDAVSSVVREGVIAAALTGMMILLFLGAGARPDHHASRSRWRSLAALTGLSLLGETITL